MREDEGMTLTEFLLARITEAEEEARYEYVVGVDPEHFPIYLEGYATWPGRGPGLPMSREDYYDLLRASFDVRTQVTNPRLLAECEAKRRIVEMGTPYMLAWLAHPYSDHPDYRDEWRP